MIATSHHSPAFVTLLLGGWWLPSNRRAITLTGQQAPAQLCSTQCGHQRHKSIMGPSKTQHFTSASRVLPAASSTPSPEPQAAISSKLKHVEMYGLHLLQNRVCSCAVIFAMIFGFHLDFLFSVWVRHQSVKENVQEYEMFNFLIIIEWVISGPGHSLLLPGDALCIDIDILNY